MMHRNCPIRHRTWRAVAKCRWPNAEWVMGEGPVVLLAHCRVLTVSLHADRESAEWSKAWIDRTACGGRCTRRHQIVSLL